MLAKKHFSGKKLILAICDSELIGKKFEEGKKDLDVSSEFYKGKKVDDDEAARLIKRAYIINAVGNKTMCFLLKNKIIEQKEALEIANIPHAQIYISIC